MKFKTNKYIEESLYYLPWKTKYIEVFCFLYIRLLKSIKGKESITTITNIFFEIFKTMLNILQKKLKYDNHKYLIFYTDIIYQAEKEKYIKDKYLYLEILNFFAQYNIDKTCIKNFKYEYLQIAHDFSKTFQNIISQYGDRDKNYTIYDNSYCLWGIPEKYYIKLIKHFLKYEKLKIARIFGSRITNEFKEFSDIDFIFEGTYSPKEFYTIRENMQQIELPYVLDIYDIKLGNKPFTYRNTIRSNIFFSRKEYIDDNYISIASS